MRREVRPMYLIAAESPPRSTLLSWNSRAMRPMAKSAAPRAPRPSVARASRRGFPVSLHTTSIRASISAQRAACTWRRMRSLSFTGRALQPICAVLARSTIEGTSSGMVASTSPISSRVAGLCLRMTVRLIVMGTQ